MLSSLQHSSLFLAEDLSIFCFHWGIFFALLFLWLIPSHPLLFQFKYLLDTLFKIVLYHIASVLYSIYHMLFFDLFTYDFFPL